jgi:hypothetical protein
MPNDPKPPSKRKPDKQAPLNPAVRIETERADFKTLVLKNPNYFGNMPDLGFPPVKVMNQKTTYEELTCVGLHPEGNKLQGVVNIKRHSGYGGGTCGDGSIEYVRFFVRRAAGWHDLGVATFTSYDLPPGSPLPVSYSVAMDMNEARQYCTVENIVKVRAILSWNQEPPAGNPGWTPAWGNVVNVKVQIAPWELPKVSLSTLISDKLLTIDASISKLIDLEETLKAKPVPPPLPYHLLKEKYTGKDVPGHRFGFVEAQKLVEQPLHTALFTKAQALASPSILADLAGILDGLFETKGNTTYEELDCVGYNPETRTLSGVITIKRNSGYSGDLCDPGSTEHVGFWGWSGGAWHALGNAQVNVHDLDAVSDGNPVRYAVFRGANLPEHLCGDITGMPLRAILSWQQAPTGPNFDPVWGNVVDTHVQPVITDFLPGDARVRLMRINRVTITKIDSSGFAQVSNIAGDCTNGNDSPFGGPLFIEGDLTLKSDAFFNPVTGDILAGQHPPAYQVWVRKAVPGATPTQLTNSFYIAVFPVNPPPLTPAFTVLQESQTIGGAEYYLYREGIIQAVNPRMLAVWEAAGLAEGAYEIEVKGFVWSGAGYVPMATPTQMKKVYLYNGYPHNELDAHGNSFTVHAPELELHIDPPAGDCGDVNIGDIVTGTYQVKDHFFGSMDLSLVPITVGGIPQPINPVVPSGPKVYPLVPTTGTGGPPLQTWSLDTGNPDDMTPCGYTVVLSSWDRAIVGNSCVGHYNQVAVGFCLRKP